MTRMDRHLSGPPLPLMLLPWLLVLISWYLIHGAHILDLRLEDTDDYMRLTQVMNWLQGADWYDLRSYRMNPPEGVMLHWSRLPDLPIALVIGTLAPIIGQPIATIAAIIIVPALLMLALIRVVWSGCCAMADREAANIAVFYLLLSFPVLSKLWPGKLDHHGWQLLLVAVMWALLMKASRQAWPDRYALLTGSTMAFSLWVGLETLPLIAAIFALLVLLWIYRRPGTSRFSLITAMAFALCCSILLPIHQPIQSLLAKQCDSLAINWVLATWLCVAYFSLLGRFELRLPGTGFRWVIAVALGAGCILLLGTAYPDCLSGPYGKMDPLVREHFLDKISEAQSSSYYLMHRPSIFIWALGFPLMALMAQTIAGPRRWIDPALFITLGLFAAALMLSFWQHRNVVFISLLAVPLAAQITTMKREKVLHRRYGALQASGWLIALSPLGAILLSMLLSLNDPKAFNKKQKGTLSIIQVLDEISREIAKQPEFSKGQAALIAAHINLGPTILAHTHHKIIAAPYHRNIDGLDKSIRLSLTDDDQVALKLVQDTGIDFILLESDNSLTIPPPSTTTFYQRLSHRESPHWLKLLPLDEQAGALLYHVELPEPGTVQTSPKPQPLHSSATRRE